MAEEVKDKKACGCGAAKSGLKVIIGLGLLALGLLAVIGWWSSLLELIKGCLGLFLILAGAITIAIAKE